MQMAVSTERVRQNTAAEVNERIDRMGQAWVSYYATHSDGIDGRLEELDREWDIERAIQANAGGLCVLGVVLGALSGRKWFLLPGVVGGFLFQHALQGWCPPVPALRRLGFRTRAEIDEEKYALRVLRGDFAGWGGANKPAKSGGSPGRERGQGAGREEQREAEPGRDGNGKRGKKQRSDRGRKAEGG
jgi:hypothetical protein